MAEIAVQLSSVSKTFRLYRERNESLKATVIRRRRASYDQFWALRDVSFDVPVGATLGLIGRNGSGKSTLLRCIARILVPDEGRITARGSVASLLELGAGFHPELTGRQNVYLNASMLRIRRNEIAPQMDAIADFADLGHFFDQPVKTYSSGMYVRLGFAVAVHVDPDVLLVDEVLAVGDAGFQAKCREKYAEFRRAGKTIILASHSLGDLAPMCDEIAQLEQGRIVDIGRPHDVVDSYLRPADPHPDAATE